MQNVIFTATIIEAPCIFKTLQKKKKIIAEIIEPVIIMIETLFFVNQQVEFFTETGRHSPASFSRAKVDCQQPLFSSNMVARYWGVHCENREY